MLMLICVFKQEVVSAFWHNLIYTQIHKIQDDELHLEPSMTILCF